MNIREFLFYENMTVAELAEKADLSRGYLDHIINRGYRPSRKAQKALLSATQGRVDMVSGLYVPRAKRKSIKQEEEMISIEISA